MLGIIYRAVSPDGKVYIGQTVKTLTHRKCDHAYQAKKGDKRGAFQIAILEYGGTNAFQWDEIDSADSQTELDAKEKYWIAHYKSDDPQFGYNIQGGGLGAKHTAESRRKLSEAKKGIPLSAEHRQNLSEAVKSEKNHNFGKHFSEEHKRKIGETRKGEKNPIAKLTENDVVQIKAALANGEKVTALAEKYGVSKATIIDIKIGRTWRSVA